MWRVVCDLEITKIFVNEDEAKAHQGGLSSQKRERKKKARN